MQQKQPTTIEIRNDRLQSGRSRSLRRGDGFEKIQRALSGSSMFFPVFFQLSPLKLLKLLHLHIGYLPARRKLLHMHQSLSFNLHLSFSHRSFACNVEFCRTGIAQLFSLLKFQENFTQIGGFHAPMHPYKNLQLMWLRLRI